MANVTSQVSPHFFWIAVKNHVAWGYKELVADHLEQIKAVTPTLPLEAMREWAESAPHDTQNYLWNLWAADSDLSGLSLEQMKSETKGLAPSILVIVWCAWARMADLSQYHRNEWLKVTEKLPMMVRMKLAEVAYPKFTQLAPMRVITGGTK